MKILKEGTEWSRFRIVRKDTGETIDSYTERKDAEDWVKYLVNEGDFTKDALEIVDSHKKETVKFPNGQTCRDDSVDMDKALDYQYGTDRDPDNSNYTEEEKQRALDYYIEKTEGDAPGKLKESLSIDRIKDIAKENGSDVVVYDTWSQMLADRDSLCKGYVRLNGDGRFESIYYSNVFGDTYWPFIGGGQETSLEKYFARYPKKKGLDVCIPIDIFNKVSGSLKESSQIEVGSYVTHVDDQPKTRGTVLDIQDDTAFVSVNGDPDDVIEVPLDKLQLDESKKSDERSEIINTIVKLIREVLTYDTAMECEIETPTKYDDDSLFWTELDTKLKSYNIDWSTKEKRYYDNITYRLLHVWYVTEEDY